MNDNERLNELLLSAPEPVFASSDDAPAPTMPRQDFDLCQWQVGANGMFRPAAKTVGTLPNGVYSTAADQMGPFLIQQTLMSDKIIRLPDSANMRVLDGIRMFWKSKARYKQHGLLFKRGVLLYGPPGSGKTITIHLLIEDLISRGGIILYCGNPSLMAYLIMAIRRIEKARPLIVVYEDIDEIINQHGEHTILALLDGEHQTDNLVSIATTNYPERLGARIVNRPSRFDDRIFVGMPSEAARLAYLKHLVGAGEVDVEMWARDTSNMSIAHLRELTVAVLCLQQDYTEVLGRLRTMNDRPRETDGFERKSVGFTRKRSVTLSGGWAVANE